jgi:valyl-tRNA synthetase
MEFEKDEMFRLMSVRMSQYKYAVRAASKQVRPRPKTPPAAPVKIEEDKTIPGEKKDTSKPLANAYDSKSVEAAWYAWWEKKRFFAADAQKVLANPDLKKYIMVIPPPNVTGALHLGHALMLAIEDAVMRWHRMSGHETLWLPGCDHAGISCQSVVEN